MYINKRERQGVWIRISVWNGHGEGGIKRSRLNTLMVIHYIKLIQIKLSLDLTIFFLQVFVKKSSPEFTMLN